MTALAFVLLLLATVVTYQSAKAEVHNQPDRAYPITGQELRAYNWIKNNTPRRASVAAYPAHVVNPAGETIVDTNFLSGMTERPAYVQRVEVYNVPEAKRRIELLNRIFDAPTQDALRDALQQAKFDYLLVYPDKPLHIDPSCCMEAVYKGTPSVYRLTKP